MNRPGQCDAIFRLGCAGLSRPAGHVRGRAQDTGMNPRRHGIFDYETVLVTYYAQLHSELSERATGLSFPRLRERRFAAAQCQSTAERLLNVVVYTSFLCSQLSSVPSAPPELLGG